MSNTQKKAAEWLNKQNHVEIYAAENVVKENEKSFLCFQSRNVFLTIF